MITWASYSALNTDLRFIWPFLRPFAAGRFWQFLLYLPFFFVFFLFNGGIRLFGQMRLKEYESPAKTQTIWWAKNVFVMLGGLVVVALLSMSRSSWDSGQAGRWSDSLYSTVLS